MSIATLMQRKPTTPTMEVVTWTPTAATAALIANTHNRGARETVVDQYARDMTNGNWRFTGDAIKFAADGTLLDGQHRLLAIIKSGVTLDILTIYGLDVEAQDVMDTGAKRGAHDQLGLHGYTNVAALAATTRLCINYLAGNFVKAGQHSMAAVTNAEVIAFVDANPDLIEAVSWVRNARRNLPIRPSTAGFTLWVLRRIDEDQANEMFDDLAELRTGGKGDPRYTLIRRLESVKRDRERMSAVTEAHYVFRTWNALRRGESLGNIKTGNAHGQFEFANPS